MNIENILYEIADRHILIYGTEDTLDDLAISEMENYLISTGVQYKIQCVDWQNQLGYAMTIAFIDCGKLHMIGWDCANRHLEEEDSLD